MANAASKGCLRESDGMSIQMDFSLFTKPDFLTEVGKGLINTLELAAIAFSLAMAVAVIIAVMRMSTNKFSVWIATAYVEYHQNVPLLVHIFLWYFGVAAILPEGAQQWINAHNSEFIFAFIGIGLCLGFSLGPALLYASSILFMTTHIVRLPRSTLLRLALALCLNCLLINTRFGARTFGR